MLQIAPFLLFRGLSITLQASVWINFFVLTINSTTDESGVPMATLSEEAKTKMAVLTYVP